MAAACSDVSCTQSSRYDITVCLRLCRVSCRPAGTKDRLCPFESAVAAVAKAPHGTLVKFDVGHFDPYVQPTLGLSLQKQVPFLKQHLGVV